MKKQNHRKNNLRWLCDPSGIQTHNPHIRSVVLYSVELWGHSDFGCKGKDIFCNTKYFAKKYFRGISLRIIYHSMGLFYYNFLYVCAYLHDINALIWDVNSTFQTTIKQLSFDVINSCLFGCPYDL